MSSWATWLARRPTLLLAIGAAAVVRAAPAIGTGFPLGDGGLFAQMALDLRANGLIPPESVNFYGAPWVYPPFGIYALALIPGDPVVTEQWLPVVSSVLLVPAVWMAVRELISDELADVAALAYGLIPWSYRWLIEGGGIARAPGALFAILAVWAAARRDWRGLGLFMGLTLLTHPEASLFGAVSVAIVWMVKWRDYCAWKSIPLAVLLAVPWFAILLPRVGVSGIWNAVMSRSGGIGDDSIRKVIVLTDLWPITLLGLTGVLVTLVARERRWLILWSIACVLMPGAIGRWLAVPWALLAAVGLWPMLQLIPSSRLLLAPAVAVMTVVLCLGQSLPVVAQQDRNALRIIAEDVDGSLTYEVVGSMELIEWFPYLARHQSVSTSVGYEWVGGRPEESGDLTYVQKAGRRTERSAHLARYGQVGR